MINWCLFWLTMLMRLSGAIFMLASIWGDDSLFVYGALTYLMGASIGAENR